MKKTKLISFCLLLTLGMATAIIDSYGQSAVSSTTDEGVVINGIKWATRNVDAPGHFADTPEAFGMFYQWNKAIGWSATDPMVNSDGGNTWDKSLSGSDKWISTNNICPTGWRIPTSGELNNLLYAGSEWTAVNGVTGRIFGIEPNTLFLPAAGSRDGGNGKLNTAGRHSFYWSNSAISIVPASGLYFNKDTVNSELINRSIGFSVRCVAEEDVAFIDSLVFLLNKFGQRETIETFSCTLLKNGTLTINGIGDMPSGTPWSKYCKNITNVVIKDGVTSIGNDAFRDCSSLVSIDIPNSVTSIGNNVFAGCSGLASITIPNSIISISDKALEQCYNLNTVKVEWKTPLVINANVFSSLEKKTLVVPTGTKSVYEAALVWKDFGAIVEEYRTVKKSK
jgi:uncharacterized protein (TIGR02145 family)